MKALWIATQNFTTHTLYLPLDQYYLNGISIVVVRCDSSPGTSRHISKTTIFKIKGLTLEGSRRSSQHGHKCRHHVTDVSRPHMYVLSRPAHWTRVYRILIVCDRPCTYTCSGVHGLTVAVQKESVRGSPLRPVGVVHAELHLRRAVRTGGFFTSDLGKKKY